MRKLKIIEHISLDGVIQTSGEDGFRDAALASGMTRGVEASHDRLAAYLRTRA